MSCYCHLPPITLITEGLSQHERVEKLNKVAIGQMKILLGDKSMKKLEGGK